LPVDVLDITLGLLVFRLDLADDSLGVVSARLLDLVNDTLQGLALQITEEAVHTAFLRSDVRVKSECSRRQERFSQAA
jgi:hypothetical protein